MWKSSVVTNVEISVDNTDDDWETDPDFVNDVSEEEQRWGSRTVPGSGRVLDHVELVILFVSSVMLFCLNYLRFLFYPIL